MATWKFFTSSYCEKQLKSKINVFKYIVTTSIFGNSYLPNE